MMYDVYDLRHRYKILLAPEGVTRFNFSQFNQKAMSVRFSPPKKCAYGMQLPLHCAHVNE